MRPYRNCESEEFPVHDVRIGLSAGLVNLVWRKGMRDEASFASIRDASMVFFAFIFGLRESSILAVRREDVREVSSGHCEVMVQILKGRTTQEALQRARGSTRYRMIRRRTNPRWLCCDATWK